MITITMDTKRLKLTVEGHAMPAESKDYQLLCNSAAALSQGLAYTISKSDAETKSIEYRPEPGNLLLRVWPEEKAEKKIRDKFENYADGLQLLAESHPCSITMIRNGQRITAKGDGKHE